MKIRTFAIIAVLSAATALPAAAQNRIATDTALASLVAAERAFGQHSVRSGAQSALLNYLATNSVIYRPAAVKAINYLRARPLHPDLALVWEPVFADVSSGGDLGYTTGPWIASSRSRADVDPTFGEFIRIWRRQDNGAWKVELDAGVAHDADPVGPSGLATAPAPTWRRPASQQQAALASLMAADSALAVAASAKGAGPAFRQRSGNDLRLLRNGRFPLKGDSAVAVLLATPGYTWRPAAGAVSSSGDIGYTYGPYVLLRELGGKEASEGGDYLRIWRRNEAGVWRVVLDLTSPTS